MANHFAKRGTGPQLSADEAQRQGRITQMAIVTLGNAAAIAFLNQHDGSLGGSPLDVAVKGPDGLAAAEQALIRRNAESR